MAAALFFKVQIGIILFFKHKYIHMFYNIKTYKCNFLELGNFLRRLGHDLSDAEVTQMVETFDTDGSGDIGFPEFVQLIREKVLEINYSNISREK